MPLKNARNDARAVREALVDAGFSVDIFEDADRAAFSAAVNAFAAKLRPGDVAVFYYSGHGMAVEGANYLLPVDFAAQSEADVEFQAYPARQVQKKLEERGTRLNILILDACRDNPFRFGRSAAGGLAAMREGIGTLVAFAAADGQRASDHITESNGLFTKHLVEALRQPGLGVRDLFYRVQERVYEASAHKQFPYIYSGVVGEFYFRMGVPAPAPAPTPTAGATKVNPKDALTYVWIPPGTFMMGCSPGDTECADNLKPAHTVHLTKGFWLGQTLVTQEAFQRITGQNPSTFRGARLPVEDLDWNSARSYCQAIGGRLPTEAEWEYAARAGTTGTRYGNLEDIAWHDGNSQDTPHEVGQKAPNGFALFDMLENAFQWTAGWKTTYTLSTLTDPSGAETGSERIVRGGAFFGTPRYLRASRRDGFAPDRHGNGLGFRCVGE